MLKIGLDYCKIHLQFTSFAKYSFKDVLLFGITADMYNKRWYFFVVIKMKQSLCFEKNQHKQQFYYIYFVH